MPLPPPLKIIKDDCIRNIFRMMTTFDEIVLEKSSPHPVGTGGNFTNNNVNNGDVEPQHTQTLVQ